MSLTVDYGAGVGVHVLLVYVVRHLGGGPDGHSSPGRVPLRDRTVRVELRQTGRRFDWPWLTFRFLSS